MEYFFIGISFLLGFCLALYVLIIFPTVLFLRYLHVPRGGNRWIALLMLLTWPFGCYLYGAVRSTAKNHRALSIFSWVVSLVIIAAAHWMVRTANQETILGITRVSLQVDRVVGYYLRVEERLSLKSALEELVVELEDNPWYRIDRQKIPLVL